MKLTKRRLVIVCGILLLAMVALCTWFYLWAVDNQKQKWGGIVCKVNVSLLRLACIEYAKEHGDTLPASLDELRPYLPTALQRLKTRSMDPYLKVWERYGGDADPFSCPLTKSHPAYEIVGAGKKFQKGDKSKIPVIQEIEPNHSLNRGRYIGYLDGNVFLR